MSARQDLINQFIEEHGKYIEEECNRQKGNSFFLEQFIADDPNGEVYVLTEEGQMELISEANGNKTKKSFKKEEIRNKISFNKIKHYIQPFQVIQAYFPFTNKTNQYTPRPVLAVPIRKNEYRFMMITTGAYTDVIYRRYETGIVDWKQAGLDHFSYARTNVVVDEGGLFFTSKSKIYGSLTDKDIISITKMLRTFREETFTNPVAFMYWLISHKVSDTIAIDGGQNNNVNPIQTIYDIEESKHANCVDIGIVVYKMCNAHKEFKPSSVGTVSWVVNNHRTCGHIFALFKYKHNTYIFDYDQCNCIGMFPNYKSSSFERAANEFSTSIKREHPHQDVRNLSLDNQLVYVLNDQDLKSLNNTNQYVDQREWLKDYSALYKSKPRNIIQGKFYRVYYNGIGIYEALRKKVGWDWKTVKQDPDINWLPTPNVKEYKDNYRSFFTTLGYKTFQAKTMKVIDKYLDPEKVEVREYNDFQGKLMYQDQYQVVVEVNNMNMLNEDRIKAEEDWIHDPSLMYRNSNKSKFDKIKNFEQFCKEIYTPEEALSYFIIEKVRWTSLEEMCSPKRPFYWPDDIIRDKIGVCMDQTILFHQFLDRKGIENKSGFMIWRDENNEDHGSHIVPMFKRNGRIYCIVYLPNLGWIHGPFDNWEECVKETGETLARCSDLVQGIGKKMYVITEVVPDEFMNDLDKITGRRDITFFQFCLEDGARRLRNTKLVMIQYKNFAIWNPIIGMWNVIRFLNNTFGLNIPYYGFTPLNEEAELNEAAEQGVNWFISEDDIYLNWDKWEDGSSHIVFIDGLSGSGKSTLGRKISENYNAYYVELDVFAWGIVGKQAVERDHCNFEYIKERDRKLYEYMKAKNIPPTIFAHIDKWNYTKEEDEFKIRELEKYLHWLAFEQDERVIVEGGYTGVIMSQNPEAYKDLPIIFKGTSVTKSIFRRICRVYGKKGPIEVIQVLPMLRKQYFDHMIPETKAARKAMLSDRDDWKYVKEDTIEEGFTELEAKKDKSPHSRKKKLDLRKIPTNIKDFKEFLQKIKTPEMVMKWFLKVKLRWTPHGGSNDHPFQWPDWLIKQKMGNCFDQSIFLHYFCRAKHIEHKMYLVTWIGDNGQGTGHAVPLYKKGNYVYIFTYLNPKMGFIAGPFRSWGEAKGVLDKYFLMHINQFFKSPSTPYSSYLSDDDMLNFDKYYNNRKITQTEYIIEGLGKNMRSSHMFKIKAKGFAFPNPILPAYDFITTVFSIINTIYNYVAVDENTEIECGDEVDTIEESKYWTREELYDKSRKKKFDKIKDFKQFCKEIDSVEEALNYFILENIVWKRGVEENEKVIIWPDELIRTKTGICFDHAVFFHYFCRSKKIESKICLMSWDGPEPWMFIGHAIPCFKRDGKIFAVIYFRPTLGWMAGPYESWEACKDNIKQIHRGLVNYERYQADSIAYADYITDEGIAKLDKVYGLPNIKQVDFLLKNGAKPLRGTYFTKIRIKGFTFADPRFFAYDILTKMRNMLGLFPQIEETNLLEEKLSADERRCFGLPKKKKYPMPDEAHVRAAIRFFNHCDPEDEEELARNIKKYMKKYNMKDVNVSDNNRFKKYYHPEDYKEEKKSIQESGTYQDTLFVYNRLSDKEKSLLGRHHEDSPACVYRKVEYSDNTPMGWIELYDSSKVAMMTNQEYDENIKDLNIGIAVDKEFRGKGVATKLIKSAVQFFKSSQYETLTYIVRDGNDRSEAFAKKCGFAYMWRRKKEHETIYMITNPSKMRNAINEAYLYIRASVNAARRSLGLIETSAALAGPVVGMETNDQTVQMSNPGMFLIHYSDDKETGYGITNDLRTKYFIRHDVKKNKLIKEEFDAFLEGKYIDIYTIPTSCRVKWVNLLNQTFNNPENPTLLVNKKTIKNLYEYFSDRQELCSDQIVYDDKFHPVSITWLELLYTPTLVNSHKTVLPCLQENYTGGDIFKRIQLPKGIQEFVKSSMHSNELLLCEDPEGYYLLDEANDLVTRHITQEELEVITNALF